MKWLVLLACVACDRGQPAPAHIDLVDVPQVADMPPLIITELARAERDGRRLVVYVGASWCEPCRHFHDAAIAGKLDVEFGNLRLLVFDADRDDAALTKAGYTYKLIPLFALPTSDGVASGKQIEGSIKGADAVAQITPRLRALLAGEDVK